MLSAIGMKCVIARDTHREKIALILVESRVIGRPRMAFAGLAYLMAANVRGGWSGMNARTQVKMHLPTRLRLAE